MYHPPSKRKQIIQRVITYSLMSFAVIGLVVVLLFVTLGYQFNRTEGRIEQGGLVQFDSKPSGANVTIDGLGLGSQTPSKTTLTPGQHFITMQREGYKQWQKSVTVLPGSVLWLNYTRLIPQDLKPKNVADFATIASTLASPDKKWIAIKENPADSIMRLADLSDDEVKLTNLTLPADSYTQPTAGKTQGFNFIKWDLNSRYILTKHTYDDTKVEWIVVDSQNVADTQNITKLLDINASKVFFSGSNSKVLYVQIGTDVRRIDIAAATLSRPLVTNVADFSLYNKTTIAYTTLVDAVTQKRSVGYYEEGASAPHIVRTYTNDGNVPLLAGGGEYFGDKYMTIAHGDTIEILQGDLANPAAPRSIGSMTLVGGVQYVKSTTDGRFIVVQNGATYAVYDLELKKASTTTLKGMAEIRNELQWLDEYTVWSDRDNMLRLYEFDGANQQDIMPVTSGFEVTLSSNGRYIYGFVRSETGVYHLERVRLIL